jgi:glycosyltransferase involved in cell wall biosynthesis
VRPRLLVVHPGAELYGSDRVALQAVVALVRAGWSVTVALPGAGPLAARLQAAGAEVVSCRMPVLRATATRPAGVWRLCRDALAGLSPAARLIRRADAVYVSTVTIPTWILLGRLLRRPVACHVHEAEQSRPRLVRLVLALPVTLADQVIVNSAFTGRVFTEAVPWTRRRPVLVRNSVPAPTVSRSPRSRLEGPVRLLFVGRLSPRKGPHVAIEALRLLRERGCDARLDLAGSVFAGYEWFEDDLREMVRLADLTERVRFLGFQADIWPALAESDVVLVPSTAEESFGNAAVEALLAARPVVVSATSGLLEVVDGFSAVERVTPGDPLELADGVERLVRAWPRSSRNAVVDTERARRAYSLTTFGEELTAVLSPPSLPSPPERRIAG